LEKLISHAHLIVEESNMCNGNEDWGCSLSGILIIILNSGYMEEDQLKELFVSPLLELLTSPNLDKNVLQSISYVLGSILLPLSGNLSPLSEYTIKEIEKNITSFKLVDLGVESFLSLIGSYLTSKRILNDSGQIVSNNDVLFLARLITLFVNSTFGTLSKWSKYLVIQIVETLYDFDNDDIDKHLTSTLKQFHIYCLNDLEAEKFTIFWNKYFEIINSFVTKERFIPLLTLNSLLNSQFQFNEWFKTAMKEENKKRMPSLVANVSKTTALMLFYICDHSEIELNIIDITSDYVSEVIVAGVSKQNEWDQKYPIPEIDFPRPGGEFTGNYTESIKGEPLLIEPMKPPYEPLLIESMKPPYEKLEKESDKKI